MTKILKHIVFVAVIAGALLFSAGASPTVMAAAMAAVAAAAAIGIAAVRHERQKYATLLEAIRNNDFTMRFQKGDKEINALLDSLTEIIKHLSRAPSCANATTRQLSTGSMRESLQSTAMATCASATTMHSKCSE